MLTTRFATTAAAAAITGGIVAISIEARKDVDTALLAVGTLTVLLAFLVTGWSYIINAVREVNRPADVAFRDGYEVGYDKGWLEARKNDRPQAVTFLQRPAPATEAVPLFPPALDEPSPDSRAGNPGL